MGRTPKGNPMVAWDVYLGRKWVDTVYYTPDCDAEYVRKGLIDRDGYHPGIQVVKT
jgi:hypothetical protein